MKHISYPEIGQFRNAIHHVINASQQAGVDVNGDPIYDRTKSPPMLTYRGTVKLHGCFDRNTPITLANGEESPIHEIKAGDVVLSYDTITNVFVEKEVTHIENMLLGKDWIELKFDDGRCIQCTEDHLFYTKNRGWV